MRQRHPHLQHVLSASCVRWRPALLSHRSTSTLSLLLHFGASQLHRATSVPLVDFIEHPINRSRRVSCCYWGTRSRFPCLRRALFSPCQAWGLRDIDYERFLRETVVNLNCAASASGWLQSVRFCSPMTTAAETCHSSSCEATDRCTFSSGHKAAMGRTRCRATPSCHGDRLFATHCSNSDPLNVCLQADIRRCQSAGRAQ